MKLISMLMVLCNLLAINVQADSTPVRHVELLIVNDNEMEQLFNSEINKQFEEINQVLYAVNAIYREVNIHFNIKNWLLFIGFSVQEKNITDLKMYKQEFDTFYKNRTIRDIKYDMLIFNSGFKFNEKDTKGVSQQDSVCTNSSSIFIGYANGGPGNEKLDTKEAIYWYAHEIGHQLGMKHNNNQNEANGVCRCPDEVDCVMSAGSKSNFTADFKFTSCSRNDLNNHSKIVEQTSPDCFKQPAAGPNCQFPLCGNGVVEKGEECDCLPDDESCKKCCTLADKSCKLTFGSRCTKEGCCVPDISVLLIFFFILIIVSVVLIKINRYQG